MEDLRFAEAQRHADSRAKVMDRLNDPSSMYVTVIRMSLTHSVAYLRFHKDECPFLGFGVACSGMSYFEGQLLRSGPHRFKVFENVDARNSQKEEWHIESDDGSFQIVTEEIWFVEDRDLEGTGK